MEIKLLRLGSRPGKHCPESVENPDRNPIDV